MNRSSNHQPNKFRFVRARLQQNDSIGETVGNGRSESQLLNPLRMSCKELESSPPVHESIRQHYVIEISSSIGGISSFWAPIHRERETMYTGDASIKLEELYK